MLRGINRHFRLRQARGNKLFVQLNFWKSYFKSIFNPAQCVESCVWEIAQMRYSLVIKKLECPNYVVLCLNTLFIEEPKVKGKN